MGMCHKCTEESKIEMEVLEKEEKYIEKLKRSSARIRDWLKDNDDPTGSGGKPVKLTGDNRSGRERFTKKMKRKIGTADGRPFTACAWQ